MSTFEVSSEFFTADELAQYLKVPLTTVYHWSASGSGPPTARAGRLLRFRRSEVEAWLRREKEATA